VVRLAWKGLARKEAMASSKTPDSLIAQKMVKLREQKVRPQTSICCKVCPVPEARPFSLSQRVTDELNDILTRENGLNDSSRKLMKNLEVAIVVSKRPGFIDYYQVLPAPQKVNEERPY
jgi:hypothetical protein